MDSILAAKRQGPQGLEVGKVVGLLGLDTRREAARTTEVGSGKVVGKVVGLLGLEPRTNGL